MKEFISLKKSEKLIYLRSKLVDVKNRPGENKEMIEFYEGEILKIKPQIFSLPDVAGRMEGSNAGYERRCRVYLQQEQRKMNPDNALVALFSDGVRIAREYSEMMSK
tara:strand:- start:215 stop:535 length:321 start_codon:yes stop_codon:yes gene_type:complete